MSSPVNPVSPISPTAAAPTTPTQTTTAPVSQLVQTQQDVSAPAPAASSPSATASSTAPTAGASAPQPSAQTNAGGTPPPKGKVNVGGLGTALSLELIVKPGLVQTNLFPTMDIGQSIPKEILLNNQTMMDLLTVDPLQQTPLKEELELEQ
jgi:hypothetical protein